MTKREQIIESVLTALKNSGAVAAASVFRSRINPLMSEKSLPCVTIEPVNDKPDPRNLAFIDWVFTIRISIWTIGEAPDILADPIIEKVHEKMMLDQTLGGLLIAMIPTNLAFEFSEGSPPIMAAHYEFDLHYRTLN